MKKTKQKPGPKPKQEPLDELLDFMIKYIKKHHVSPTQQLMADHFNVARFAIQNRLRHLEEQGKVKNHGRRGFTPVK